MPSANGIQPLTGIVVLELSVGIMGPHAGAVLGDLGAEVIKIEDARSADPFRHAATLAGFLPGLLPNDVNAFFEGYHRNKKGIAIDLKTGEGRSVLYRLVEKSDVFLTSYRAGVLERLRVDYRTLSAINPKLIYARGSGFGTKGPDRDQVAWDGSAQARSGLMYAMGGDEPRFPVDGIADQTAGILLAMGVLAAIVARERTGIGQEVDSSLLCATTVAVQPALLVWLLTKQRFLTRRSRLEPLNPTWNTYRCADGKWLVLTLGTFSDRYWPLFCQIIDREALATDPNYLKIADRQRHAKELVAVLDGIFSEKSRDEWVRILNQADISWAVVQDVPDLEEDPQMLENRYIVDWDHPDLGSIRVPGFLFNLSETPASIRLRAPRWGEHTEEVLKALGGYSENEIAEMKTKGVLR